MRGRGLAARTITDSVLTLRRLQNVSGYPIESTPALAISRFLGDENLGARARYTYFGHLRGFFRWLANEGLGADAMATLPRPRMPRCTPRPITTEQLQALLALSLRRKTRAMVMLAALAGYARTRSPRFAVRTSTLTRARCTSSGRAGTRRRSRCIRCLSRSHAKCRRGVVVSRELDPPRRARHVASRR